MRKSIKIVVLTGLVGFFLICSAGASTKKTAETTALTGFRFHAGKDKTRLVFEFNHPFSYRIFSLAHPARFVIDLKPAIKKTTLNRKGLQHTLVKDIRTGPHPEGRLRLVLDLNKPATEQHFSLTPKGKYKYRLVLDVLPRAIMPLVPVKKTKAIAAVVPEKSEPALPTPVRHVLVHPPHKTIIVAIDPGHGGKDPGATGMRGTHEKDVVLTIAKRLRDRINAEPGYHAILTRKGDYFMTLRERLQRARRERADLYMSIHADAYQTRGAHGASVFALSRRGATSEAARWIAENENRSVLMGGANLSNRGNLLRSVLIDLSQTATIGASLQFANILLHEIGKTTELHRGHVEQAAFVVLKSPDIPSVLVETGFLSNPAEEAKLLSPHYEQRLTFALLSGIKNYFSKRMQHQRR